MAIIFGEIGLVPNVIDQKRKSTRRSNLYFAASVMARSLPAISDGVGGRRAALGYDGHFHVLEDVPGPVHGRDCADRDCASRDHAGRDCAGDAGTDARATDDRGDATSASRSARPSRCRDVSFHHTSTSRRRAIRRRTSNSGDLRTNRIPLDPRWRRLCFSPIPGLAARHTERARVLYSAVSAYSRPLHTNCRDWRWRTRPADP